MSKLTIYPKPTCATCRETMAILKEAGVDFEAVNYRTAANFYCHRDTEKGRLDFKA
ncbi:hypothetical protein FBQ87_12070 [Sphingobacteriales bacterium CHB3]|nr:hypothetical protein [Sphingobacteriales bacterium CHB3]